MSSGPILVPYDGSPSARRALPYAAALARLLQSSRIILLTVLPGGRQFPARPGESPTHTWEVTARRSLRAASRRLRQLDAGDVYVETRLAEWESDAIAKAAEEHLADFIVMGTHGRSGLRRALLGSVAMAVIRESKLPTLLVPPGPRLREAKIGRVLLTIDGSELSYESVPVAATFAKAGADVRVLRVLRSLAQLLPLDFSPGDGNGYLSGELIDAVLAAESQTADQDLKRAMDQLPPGAASAAVREDRVDTAIVHEAIESKSDLIIMTTHARSGLARAFLGSVADRVVRSAPVPVLLVRPSEE